MLRRKIFDDDDDESSDRWLVSYADFITLLFAFFVVMYSISSVNKGKYNQLSNSMGIAFTGINIAPLPLKSAGSADDGKLKGQQKSLIKPLPLSHIYNEKLRRERESMTKMGVGLSNTLAPLIEDGKIKVLQNNRGIRIDINDSLLFNAGSSEISASATDLMNEIAKVLKDNPRLIQVEGHTDNISIHNATFFSNWELSAVRASSVVRMLSATGIAEKRLSALGFGAVQPVTENETAVGRAKNRRVSIMVLYESMDQEDSSLEIMPTQINGKQAISH